MTHAIIYPDAMMVHSQNTSLANTAMMCTWGFIVGALLAISQVPTLALDLMDRSRLVLDVGQEGGRDTSWICRDGQGVVEDACGGEGGEDGGVDDPGGGDEAEPGVDEDEDGGEVDVGNGSGCR